MCDHEAEISTNWTINDANTHATLATVEACCELVAVDTYTEQAHGALADSALVWRSGSGFAWEAYTVTTHGGADRRKWHKPRFTATR